MIAGRPHGTAQVDKDELLHQALARGADLDVKIAECRRVNAELRADNEALEAKVEELTRLVAEMAKERDQNSRNSNKPPSSDGLGDRRRIRKRKMPTGRKKGGQKGHKGCSRELLAANMVDDQVDVLPKRCEMCGKRHPPSVPRAPKIRQVVELLETGGRFVTEYRLQWGRCACGEPLRPAYAEVPSSAFGPRLKSVVAALTGSYQLSRRRVVLFLEEMYHIKMSLGSVSNIEGEMTDALQEPSDEALTHAIDATTKHVDETSWLQDFATCSAWVIATAAVSVFRITKNGRRASLLKILRHKAKGVLISDRASVFLFWSMQHRQVCWSHLQRKFIGFSERDGPAGEMGADLAACADLVFGYWRQYFAGELSREVFLKWIGAVQATTREHLERAVAAQLDEVSGSCANMLEHWDALWAFVHTPGVEPSNNHAERELRRLVIWRRTSYGTQSDRGQRFVERMMTVTHTLRKQRRQVMAFLYSSIRARLNGASAPLLLAVS